MIKETTLLERSSPFILLVKAIDAFLASVVVTKINSQSGEY